MSDNSAPLASLSLTHVYYDPHDSVSLVCAYLALLPQALCVVYATLILTTREAEIALMFAGQLACEALNFVLKRIIKEERPARIHGKGYGMPSSHAQFVAFWSLSVALFLLVRHRPAPANRRQGSGWKGASDDSVHRPWSVLERVGMSAGATVLAAAVAWSRVYLAYHSTKQVIVGCGAGVAMAGAWFLATAVLRRTGWLYWAMDTSVGRALRVRDLVVEEDISQAGWEKWVEKKAAEEASQAKGAKAKLK